MKINVALVSLLIFASSDFAHGDFVVVPNANAAVSGNQDNQYPFLIPSGQRYQQVFAAAEFGAMGGARYIDQLALRNGDFSRPFSTTIQEIDVSLSTCARSPDAPSLSFADNLGPDTTLVYSGPLSLGSSNDTGPGNTKVFDILITFQTPFLYDPTQGNLLLEVRNYSGSFSSSFRDVYLDVANAFGDSLSRVHNAGGDSTFGTSDSIGLIVRFRTAVPEPSTMLLAIAAIAALPSRLRRRPFSVRGVLQYPR